MRVSTSSLLLSLAVICCTLSVVSAGTLTPVFSRQDFTIHVVTATHAQHASSGTGDAIKITFYHRTTFEEYTATLSSNGLGAGFTKTVKYIFSSAGTSIQDMKGFSLHIDSGSDGWLCDNVVITDSSGVEYFVMNPTHSGLDQSFWVDNSKHVLTYDMHYELNQLLPLAPASTEDQLRMTLFIDTSRYADGPKSGLELRLYQRNLEFDATLDQFDSADWPSSWPKTLAKGGQYTVDLTLRRGRLGDVRRVVLENTNNNGIYLDEVQFRRKVGSTWVMMFERDINDDSRNWKEWIDGNGFQKSVAFEFAGGNWQSEWTATTGSTDVTIAIAGSGTQTPVRTKSATANFQLLMQTLDSASAGASSSDRTYVETALYKCDDGSVGHCSDLHNMMELVAARTNVEVRLIEDDRITLSPDTSKVHVFKSKGGIMALEEADGACGNGGDCMMHHKFICVSRTGTNDYSAVLVTTANMHNSGHQRIQNTIRVTNFDALYMAYHIYFNNLLKYDGTALTDLLPDDMQPTDWQGKSTDAENTFDESTPCNSISPSHCEAEGPPYDIHEYGSNYDMPLTAIGAAGKLAASVSFSPRAGSDSPWKTAIDEVTTWLDGDSARRAELYFMHLSQSDSTVTMALRNAYEHSQAQVYVLTSMMNKAGVDNQDYTRSNAGTEGLHARYEGPSGLFRVHAKSMYIKRWLLSDSGSMIEPEFDIYTGSMNSNVAARVTRDNNLLRLQWTGGATDTSTLEFEEAIYRPLVDQFMAAYNENVDVDWIGRRN